MSAWRLLAAIALVALSAPTGPAQAAPAASTIEAADPAEDARLALRSRQFETALGALRTPAERGDPEARYLLGLALDSGFLGANQTEAARRWLRAAAEQQHAAAAFALAGSLVARDPKDMGEARRWLERAAALGYPIARDLQQRGALPYTARRPGPDAPPDLRRRFAFWAAAAGEVADLSMFTVQDLRALRDDQGRSLVAVAAERGRAVIVETLIASGVDCNAPDRDGLTALMLAAKQPDIATTSLLLRSGANVAAVDAAGRTALMHAAWSDQAAQVSVLAAAGARLDSVDARGWTALDIALRRERLAAVAALLAIGAPASPDKGPLRSAAGIDTSRTGRLYVGWPALLLAVSRDDVPAVQRTLAESKGTELRSPQGYAALDVAVESGATRVVPLLLAAGHDPLAVAAGGESPVSRAARRRDIAMLDLLDADGAIRRAPARVRDEWLIASVMRGHGDVSRWLLAHGASASAKTADGTPVLSLAVAVNGPEVVRSLLSAGADTDAADARGRSALWYAASSASAESLQLLLDSGASPDLSDARGMTPLMAAARVGNVPALEALLGAGASPVRADQAGDTALHVAAAGGHNAAVQRLLRARAEIDRSNAAGDTPLIVAARHGHADVCALLLKAGADSALRNQNRLTARDVAELRGFAALARTIASR